MGFLSPWFLAGLLAVGLPLWLHLLRQFRRTPRPFSSLMFFERRVQSSTKHRRLRYLALLAARLLVLILLALAFANPFVNRTPDAIKRTGLTVIAIDKSFSMRYGNRLEEAKAEANRVIDRMPGRERAEVIAFAARFEHLTSPETDKGTLHAAVNSITASDETSSFGEFSRAMRMMDQNTGMHLHVNLVSDLQQTSTPSAFADLQLGPHTSLEVHPVGEKKSPNWAVESVNAPAHVFDAAHTRITATIAGWQTEPSMRNVSLLIDGKVVSTKSITVPDCGRGEVEFSGFEVPYGVHRGEVRVEPHDKLPQDDSFPLALERSDPRKILFLYRQGHSRDAFYYKAAIESSPATGLTVQAEPLEQALTEDFSKYAFVLLSDPGMLAEKLERDLGTFVSKGGSLFLTVGPGTTQTGKLPLTNLVVQRTGTTQGAGVVDNNDAALLGNGQFQNVEFLDPGRIGATPACRIIAKFADGSPLLFEQRIGEGRLLVFGSTLDNSGSDFALHTTFLPFAVQTGAYLSGAEDSPSGVAVNSPVTLRRTQTQTTAADVIGPDGKHELSLNEAAKSLTYDLPTEGFYEVLRADGHRQLMAVHADRRESDLTRIPEETLDLWRNTGSSTPGGATGTSDVQSRPWSLWHYAMILLLIAALIESIFANRYLRGERQTT